MSVTVRKGARFAHRWYRLSSDGGTEAMNTPSGVLVRIAEWGEDEGAPPTLALALVPGCTLMQGPEEVTQHPADPIEGDPPVEVRLRAVEIVAGAEEALRISGGWEVLR